MLRSCFCRAIWSTPLDPDVIAVAVERRDRREPFGARTELLVLDGTGRQIAAWPFDGYTVAPAYLVEAAGAGAGGTLVGVLEEGRFRLYDPTTGDTSVAADGLRDDVRPAVAWPLIVEYRHPDTLVLYDASDAMHRVTELALPAGRGCRPEGFLEAYAGQVALHCTDDSARTRRTTVMTLPSHR